ncbi:P-loop containing nucleoside triphosphate hydrolase protein [Aspergillus californicus]
MDQFLLANVQRYQTLVARFKPPHVKDPSTDLQTSPNLVVATRIRPILDKETKSGQVSAVFPRRHEKAAIDIHELRNSPRGPPSLNSFCFRSDRTFGPDESTPAIYHEIVQPLLPWTGSGKTFTVSALERLIARHLFEDNRAGRREIYVSFVELAGNSAYDLLNDRAPCQILEDAFGTTQLSGIVEEHATSSAHLLSLVEKADSFRRTAPTAKNDRSSRSHAICRLRIVNQSPSSANPDGVLYMIDLAGSEAARDVATHSAARMKETREHLFDPDSNLNCKTVILGCTNPSFLDVGASKNTLRYADMLRIAFPKPKTTSVEYDPVVPESWMNKDLRNYIKLQSGSPAISASDLAPTESGAQLLRLPVEEFVRRCLQTPGVRKDQATAFHSKLWAMHVRSQRNLDSQPKAALAGSFSSSSKEVDEEKAKLPFTERIRPGMAVRWTSSADGSSACQQMALVLSPVGGEGGQGEEFLCAMVLPGSLDSAYEVHLWRQVVVHVDDMQAEVLLEYDSATRYYFIAV